MNTTTTNCNVDLESQLPLRGSSPPGAFPPTSDLQHKDLPEEKTAPNAPAADSGPPPASEPKTASAQESGSSQSQAKNQANVAAAKAVPNAEATASPSATPESQAQPKRDELLSEYDEPLFEDTPESTFWTEYLNLAEKRDRVLVEGWNKSMDVLLIFAGLFSAIVTAFLIEAYKGLSEDNTATSNTLLRQISASMGNMQPEGSLELTPFKASPGIVRVNCMWFASLIISLSAAVVIVLAKQWIDDYDDYQKCPGSSRERGRIRQSRYTNLLQWGIPTIIESLPTLLLTALGLFFIGLVDFLSAIDVAMAIVSMVFISLITAFFIITTLLPAFSPRCAYKAPISSFFLMLKIAALLYSKYIACLSRYGILWLRYLSTQLTRNELKNKLWQVSEELKSSSGELSSFHFISGWRTVIRKAEQEYVTSTVEIINARAIAWLMESSTNEAHIHAAIRATAGLALAEEEQLRILKDAGVGKVVMSRLEALDQHYHGGDWTKVNLDDAMTMVAGKRCNALLGEDSPYIGTLGLHQDPNIACLDSCAALRYGGRLKFSDGRLEWSEDILQRHTATVRKRVLVIFFRALRDRMLMDAMGGRRYELSASTIDVTLLLLEQRIRASWHSPDVKDDVSRAILSMWQSQPVAAQSTPDVSPPVLATLNAIATFFTPESSNERCVAISGVIDALCERYLHLHLYHEVGPRPVLRDVLDSLAGALVFVERPRQVWSSIIKAVSRLSVCVRSPRYMDEPDFNLACARRISQTPENASEILLIARGAFWNALAECSREGTVRQLRNIGQSLLIYSCKGWGDGTLSYAEEILKSPFLSIVGNRIHSLYSAPTSDFDDDDFLFLIFFTDISARLHLSESSKGNVAFGGIVSSLVHAWEMLTDARGQPWLDERIAFWQVHEPSLWKGDTDEARLDSLAERCEATGRLGKPLLGRPDADKLLLAAHITPPESE